MIKLESIHIEELRGIRKLDIDFKQDTFAISGPNGSGKSGVIDAIEFGLTGQIGRLTGRGTGDLSVSAHGPHVDKTMFPDAAWVKIKAFLPKLNKSVTITRKVSSSQKPVIVPDDKDVILALAEIADHPEITLSRREILRLILVEPAKRSETIQTILKLDALGQTRSVLNAANNKLKQSEKISLSQMESNRQKLLSHLQIATLLSSDVLKAVNSRRTILSLPEISELTKDTKLDSGLNDSIKTSEFNKVSALRDIQTLIDSLDKFKEFSKKEIAEVLQNINKLENDTSLYSSLMQHSFIETGLDFINGAYCPFCDVEWESAEKLRFHLSDKLKKSKEAQMINESLINSGTSIGTDIVGVKGFVSSVLKLTEELKENVLLEILKNWKLSLEKFKGNLLKPNQIIMEKNRLENDWLEMPDNLFTQLESFKKKLKEIPDQSATSDAQTFLNTAQLRLADYRESLRKHKESEIASREAKTAYELYCAVLEEELNILYDSVQKDFCSFYSTINAEDEPEFTAILTPSEGSLSLDVNFFNRGLFPPGAYHSEGHQDGMGVCLYLALMKHLFGDQFTFALLDDVVMSVDSVLPTAARDVNVFS